MPDSATAAFPVLRCGRYTFDLARPRVMGILNVTPNSFSDGGRYFNLPRALEHARQMIRDGADMIDIGGESTRPGAAAVSEAEELRRILPVLQRLTDLPVSVDTRRPAVMRAALEADGDWPNAAANRFLVVCADVRARLAKSIDPMR